MVQQITARPGQKADLLGPEDILQLHVTGNTLVNDGDVVVRNTDGQGVSAVAGAANTKFAVVLRYSLGKSGKNADGSEAYQAKDIAPIMAIGRIWVKTTMPVTDITAAVYVKTANGTTEAPLGSLSASSVDGTAFPNASWETTTNAEGLAILRLRGA